MHPKSPKLLNDIIDASGFALDFASGKTFDDYDRDRGFRYVIERSFGVIGEALNRLQRIDPDTAESIHELRSIIGFRNRLAHGYDDIDNTTVWKILTESLPALQLEIEAVLIGSSTE